MKAIVSRLNALHTAVAAACGHTLQPATSQLARPQATVVAAAAAAWQGLNSCDVSCSSKRWASTTAASNGLDAFGTPPALPQRRVVVTGIGIVSPLGVGVSSSWERLIQGQTGVRRLQEEDLPEVCVFFPASLCLQECLRCMALSFFASASGEVQDWIDVCGFVCLHFWVLLGTCRT
jgi:hypothetical protein